MPVIDLTEEELLHLRQALRHLVAGRNSEWPFDTHEHQDDPDADEDEITCPECLTMYRVLDCITRKLGVEIPHLLEAVQLWNALEVDAEERPPRRRPS